MSLFKTRFAIAVCMNFAGCGLLHAQATSDATWQVSTIPYGTTASMAGTGTSSSGRDKVQFVVSCTNGNLLSPAVLIPMSLMTYTVNDYANAAVDDPQPKLGRFQVATGPELKLVIDGNAGDDSPHRLTMNGIPNSFYSAELAGKTIKITLQPPPGKLGGPVALNFVVPSDPSPMLSVAKPCLKASTSPKRSPAKKNNP